MYHIDHAKHYYQQNQERLLAQVNKYNSEHRDEKRAYNKLYDDTHKEERRIYERARYLAHREEFIARNILYFKEHALEKREYDRLHYEANLEKLNAYHRKYFKDHPEKGRLYRMNRRARELDIEGTLTPVEWMDKCEEYDNRCAYCGTRDVDTPEGKLTPEHIIPLGRGGPNTIDNILPACKSCNDEKHTMTAEEFFESIEAGREEGVLIRRYINEHPEEMEKLELGDE